MNIHQPDLPRSCQRLIEMASDAKKRGTHMIKEMIDMIPPAAAPASEFAAAALRPPLIAKITKYTAAIARFEYQYVERGIRPLNFLGAKCLPIEGSAGG